MLESTDPHDHCHLDDSADGRHTLGSLVDHSVKMIDITDVAVEDGNKSTLLFDSADGIFCFLLCCSRWGSKNDGSCSVMHHPQGDCSSESSQTTNE